MKIERIGLSLDSIAEERRQQHRERPDTEPVFEEAVEQEASHAAARLGPVATPEASVSWTDRVDDPTARLRLEHHDEGPRRSLREAIDAFTGYDDHPGHELPDTDL